MSTSDDQKPPSDDGGREDDPSLKERSKDDVSAPTERVPSTTSQAITPGSESPPDDDSQAADARASDEALGESLEAARADHETGAGDGLGPTLEESSGPPEPTAPADDASAAGDDRAEPGGVEASSVGGFSGDAPSAEASADERSVGDGLATGPAPEEAPEATSASAPGEPGSAARTRLEGTEAVAPDDRAGADSEPSPDEADASESAPAEADPGSGGTPAVSPSATPKTSMLGSVNEARSWLLELPDFEGPLDLLLHLVRRHELDILDIPISFVTEKYLEYLAFMQALDLEVAGDYLVMAATLAYLKSRELVPTEPTEVTDEGQSEDEGPDPREELIARLLEYQKYRAAASDLDQLPIQGRDVFSRGGRIELPPVDPGLAPLTLFRLAEAYNRVLDRARIHKSHDVVLETVSVAQRMNQLTSMLIEQERVEFEGLFLGRTWNSESELRSMLVVTLMSVLELTKLGVIFVHQDTANGAIVIERKATPEEAKQAIADYDENISFGKAKPGVAEASASGEAASSSEAPVAPPAAEPDAEPDSDV